MTAVYPRAIYCLQHSSARRADRRGERLAELVARQAFTARCGVCGAAAEMRLDDWRHAVPLGAAQYVCMACARVLVDVCPNCFIFLPPGVFERCPSCNRWLTSSSADSEANYCRCGRPWGPEISGPDWERREDGSYPLPYGSEDARQCGRCYAASNYTPSRYGPDVPETHDENPHHWAVGVEIEFKSPGIPRLAQWGTLKRDGSVYDSWPVHAGHEFASIPLKGDAVFAMLRETCAEITRVGGFVDSQCGVHVHLDVHGLPDNERKRILRYWAAFEEYFYALVAPSRKHNEYCQSIKLRQPRGRRERYLPRGRRERYLSLNRMAFEKYGTFEVRLHHGSLDAAELCDWVSILCQAFSGFARTPVTPHRLDMIQSMTPRERQETLRRLCRVPRQDWVRVLGRMRRLTPRHDFVRLITKKAGHSNV